MARDDEQKIEILRQLEGLQADSAASEEKARRKALLYRRVFDTPEGHLVLTDILNELRHYAMEETDVATLALQNAAKRILGRLGAWTPENIFELTEQYLNLPLPAFREQGEAHDDQ